MLVVIIVLGALAVALGDTARFTSSGTATAAENQTTAAYNTMVDGVNRYSDAVSNCSSISCARHQAGLAAGDLRDFAATIDNINYPPSAVNDAQQLQAAAGGAALSFQRLSHAESPAVFSALARQIRPQLTAIQGDYHVLVGELRSLQ